MHTLGSKSTLLLITATFWIEAAQKQHFLGKLSCYLLKATEPRTNKQNIIVVDAKVYKFYSEV